MTRRGHFGPSIWSFHVVLVQCKQNTVADWYYIGHYGQLGPLTREQVDELIEGGVITRETYVWRSGLAQWQYAEGVTELGESFRRADPYMSPPPPPMPTMAPPSLSTGSFQSSYTNQSWTPSPVGSHSLALRSDKNRVLAGFLNYIPPGGIGRMYLGYAA